METFSKLLPICAWNSPVPGEFPAQRPVTRRFDVFFDLHPNKRLSKQWKGWWFETPSCPLWRHRNDQPVSISQLHVINTFSVVKQLTHINVNDFDSCEIYRLNNCFRRAESAIYWAYHGQHPTPPHPPLFYMDEITYQSVSWPNNKDVDHWN